jgi:cytochrome c7-like protein
MHRTVRKGYLCLFVTLFIVCFVSISETGAQRRRNRRRTTAQSQQKPRVDYARFSHRTHVEEQKLGCDSCHKFPSKNWKEVRKGDDAFPDVTDFPEHAACLECHRTQFFARERPAPTICSNCHVAVTPRNTARHPFPSLGEPFLASKQGQNFVSEFNVAFPHDKHVDVVGWLPRRPHRNSAFALALVSFINPTVQDAKSKSCVVCHQTYQPQGKSSEEFVTKRPANLAEEAFWLKKGAFKTTPTSHAACSACHNKDAGIPPDPSDCATCHKRATGGSTPQRDFDPKQAQTMGINDWLMLRKWSRRSAGRYQHDFEVHRELSCVDCHNPAVMNTLDEKTFVAIKSCGGSGGCHIETTSEGILNYEIEQKRKNPNFQCTKCHIMLGKNPVPQNHLDAIPKPASK